MDSRYDVFVSHNRHDKPWVREFVSLLRSNGLRVFFDEDSIPFGAPVDEAIETAIELSAFVVFIISPSSVSPESRWVALECSLTVYSDPDARLRRIIPVLLEPTERAKIKASVRRLNMVDVTDRGRATFTFRRFLAELGVQNSESVDVRRLLPAATAAVVVSKGRARAISRFREPANDWYVPRKEQQLMQQLALGADGPNILLTGKTGVGKSSLLNWVAGSASAQGYSVIRCAPLSDRIADLLDAITHHALDLLETLEVRPKLRGVPQTDCHDVLIKLALHTTRPILIILDQVERLFPSAMASPFNEATVWQSLMDACGELTTHPRMKWIFAVKEWYFLNLFPTEIALRANNLTYLSLGNLERENAVVLVQRLAELASVAISVESADLIATKTNGKPIALILTFINAIGREPAKTSIEYEDLSASAPWNDIFDADLRFLDSRQRQIILAMAHSGREVVSEGEVIDKVIQVIPSRPDEVVADLHRLDHEKDLIVRNDGFVSFVHSGFGVFVHGKYAQEYSPHWNASDQMDHTRSERDLVQGMTLLGTMMAGFTHVLRNRLNVISAVLANLREASHEKALERVTTCADHLQEEINRMAITLRDVASFSQESVVGTTVFTGLRRMIEEAAIPLLTAHPNMTMCFADGSKEYDTVRLNGDGSKIRILFVELLKNAIQHSGAVEPMVQVTIHQGGASTLFCDFEDNGSGIPEEIISHLFKPFFTTSAHGTGLGLAMASIIMRSCKGAIELMPSKTGGALFRLHFAIAEGPTDNGEVILGSPTNRL